MRRIFRLSWNPPSLVPQRESGSLLPVIIMKIGCFHSSYVVLEDHPQLSPQWESRVPFPIQPGSCPQECSSWDVNLSTRRVLVGITVLVHNQGSGFPLRQELWELGIQISVAARVTGDSRIIEKPCIGAPVSPSDP